MLRNPILKGFNPDPCICKKGDDYYIAVSTFEWFPGIPIYHSKDMKHWELYTHVLTDDSNPDLKKLPSAKGIWAPCLTYCEEEDLFYVVYGVMNSMNARYFDVDNFVITAKNIEGPWSEPVYLHSSGFDASILHDDDGRKYIVSLDWETREGYEKPGVIAISEYDPVKKEIIGYPKRIWKGGTDRGCIEAPHLTKRNGYYYIMCAEGGTGYNHCVTMGRSRNIWGPYEGDPKNPIVTSNPVVSNERHDPDHLKPKYFNPDTMLQKAGHGSYVETSLGEVYLVHLCARPFRPELRCTLGRETAIQKMKWTEDGWLRMADGSNIAKEYCEESGTESQFRTEESADTSFSSVEQTEESEQINETEQNEQTKEAGLEEPQAAKREIGADPKSGSIHDLNITVNGEMVSLKGKKQYIVVDILDFYPVDTSVAHGNRLLTAVNGMECDFTYPLREGDAVRIEWVN